MKSILQTLLLVAFLPMAAFSQTSDSQAIKMAGFNYIEGFYEGDTAKLAKALSPSLDKYGYYNEGGSYSGKALSYKGALDLALRLKANDQLADADAPKEVEILDQQEYIAAIKVTARWGVDYMLLSKQSGDWKIEKVLWQGPLETVSRSGK